MTLAYGTVQEAPPTAGTDGATPSDLKATKHGGLWTANEFPEVYGPTIRGQDFRACNPTPGTGIAMSITTSFSATAALAILRNSESSSAAGSKRILLRHLKLICTAAGATTTSSHLAVMLDPTAATRYSSGGSTLTGVNANSESGTGSIAQVFFGAVVATAASGGVRQVARCQLKTQAAPCWNVGDEVILTTPLTDYGAGLLSGAAAARFVIPIGPVLLAPTHSLVFHMWNPANATTPPSWECEFAWVER